jgi:hypothetical protein
MATVNGTIGELWVRFFSLSSFPHMSRFNCEERHWSEILLGTLWSYR